MTLDMIGRRSREYRRLSDTDIVPWVFIRHMRWQIESIGSVRMKRSMFIPARNNHIEEVSHID